MVRITRMTSGQFACELGDPGPFVVLTYAQLKGIVHAMALLGMIQVNGRNVNVRD